MSTGTGSMIIVIMILTGMPCIQLIIMPDDLLIFHGTIPFTIHGIMDRTLMIPGTIIHLIMAMDIGVVAILILIMVQDIIIPAGGAGMAEADTRNHNRRKNHVIGSVVIPTIAQAVFSGGMLQTAAIF